MTSDLDLEALESAYDRALELERSGQREDAIAAWQQVLALDPEDCGGAAMRLAALGEGTPDRASPAYVMTLFDQHAEVFESILVDQLGYDIPKMVRTALNGLAQSTWPRLLDLGCGTGLVADALEDITSARTGIDLSSEMVAIAGESGLYKRLYTGDAVRFVESMREDWDLVVAADTLPYLGDLKPLFQAVASRLPLNGIFAFSTELPPEKDAGIAYGVGPHHRFFHSRGHIDDLLDAASLTAVHNEEVTVRLEEGEPIRGQLVLARKT